MLSFEQFKNVIDKVDSARAEQCKVYQDFDVEYKLLDKEVIDLLTLVMDDVNGFIDLWVNDLDCGHNGGMYITDNGTERPLFSVEDLYRILTI